MLSSLPVDPTNKDLKIPGKNLMAVTKQRNRIAKKFFPGVDAKKVEGYHFGDFQIKDGKVLEKWTPWGLFELHPLTKRLFREAERTHKVLVLHHVYGIRFRGRDTPFLYKVWHGNEPKVICRVCFHGKAELDEKHKRRDRNHCGFIDGKEIKQIDYLKAGGQCDFCGNVFLTPKEVIKIERTIWEKGRKESSKRMLLENNPSCPKCHGLSVSNGSQRWLCRSCGKQWSKNSLKK